MGEDGGDEYNRKYLSSIYSCRLYYPEKLPGNTSHDKNRVIKPQSQIVGFGYKPICSKKSLINKLADKDAADKESIKFKRDQKYIGYYTGKFPSAVLLEDNKPHSNIDYLNFCFPSDFEKILPIFLIANAISKGKLNRISGYNPDDKYHHDHEDIKKAVNFVKDYFSKHEEQLTENIISVFNETKRRRVTCLKKMSEKTTASQTMQKRLQELEKLSNSLVTENNN